MECIPVLPYIIDAQYETNWPLCQLHTNTHSHTPYLTRLHMPRSLLSFLPTTHHCCQTHAHCTHSHTPRKQHTKAFHWMCITEKDDTHRRDQIVHATILSFIFYDFSLFRIELLPNKWISFFLVSFQLWVLKFFVLASVPTRVYWLYTIGLNGGMHSNGTVAIYVHIANGILSTENTEYSKRSSSSNNYYRVVAYHCCIAVQTQKN